MTLDNFTLSERKHQLLLSAVGSYIENALPITSGSVQSNYFSSLSSATLRNELATLEEMGYLKQLHTSSGRIPTTKAYRYYVDNIISSSAINEQTLDQVKLKFTTRSAFLVDMLDGLAKKIGEITEYPTFAMMSGVNELYIDAVNVIPLMTGQTLLLLQTNAGIINNTVQLSNNITEENCKDASKFLTNNLKGKKIIDVVNNFEDYQKLFKNQIKYFDELFGAVTDILKEWSKKQSSFVTHNTTKLLDSPEVKDINSAKKFYNLVENQESLKQIIGSIDENSSNDVVFSIGDENENPEFNDYSIVKANYHLSNGITASVGVLGPERMDYAKIASALKFVVDEISNMDNKGE